MSEIFIVGLLFGGGIVVALICLIVASLGRRSRVTKGVLCGCAIAALVSQGGCWVMASDIGQGTGGGNGGSGGLVGIVVLALVVAVFWTMMLMSKGSEKKS